MTHSTDCVHCQKSCLTAFEILGSGELIHHDCMAAVMREMDAHDRMSNGEHVECDHCRLPIDPESETWSSFEMFMHESCKEEHLTVMAIPRGTNSPRRLTLQERIKIVFFGWSDLLYQPREDLAERLHESRFDDRN